MVRTAVGIAEVSVGERRDDVRRMLLEHQRELLSEIQSRVRDVREGGSNSHYHTTDLPEMVEAEPQDDLVFAPIQMKAKMLERVNESIRHCDEGTYGYCVACGEAIASSRLRTLPFAVRCRDCEETREDEQQRARVPWQRVRSRLDSRY
jgi:DnaK suppressor protein